MAPSNHETVSELLNSNETVSETTYITALALARKQRRLLLKKQIQWIALSVGFGFLLRFVCRELVQRNPDFFKEDLENPEKKIQVRNMLREILQRLRGGALVERNVGLGFLKTLVVNLSVTAGGTLAIEFASVGSVLCYLFLTTREEKFVILANALPSLSTQIIPIRLTKNPRLTAVKEIERECGNTFHFLFRMLLTEDLPYEIKMEEASKIIQKMDWWSPSSAITIGCIVILLSILFVLKSQGFYI